MVLCNRYDKNNSSCLRCYHGIPHEPFEFCYTECPHESKKAYSYPIACTSYPNTISPYKILKI